MAKFHLYLGIIALALLTIGCQQQQGPLVDLPEPNFNGPTIAQQPRVVMIPPTRAAAPVKIAPKSPDAHVPTAWIPRVAPRPWEWIVVHHSATPAGGAARFDRDHRQKGWDELGYDFVIGNGTDTGDGQIEVGPRWPVQKWGAHTKTPDNRFNERGIGICLVGNFDEDRPTAAQIQSLVRLTTYLMRTYHIRPADIIGHNQAKPTDCPGRNLSVAAIRAKCVAALATEETSAAEVLAQQNTADAQTAGGELLKDEEQK